MNTKRFICDSCGKEMEHIHFGKPNEKPVDDRYSSKLCPACWQKEVKILGWHSDINDSKRAAFKYHGPCDCFDDVV